MPLEGFLHDVVFGRKQTTKEPVMATIEDVLGEFRKYKAEAEATIAELRAQVEAKAPAVESGLEGAVDEIAQAVQAFGGNALPAERVAVEAQQGADASASASTEPEAGS